MTVSFAGSYAMFPTGHSYLPAPATYVDSALVVSHPSTSSLSSQIYDEQGVYHSASVCTRECQPNSSNAHLPSPFLHPDSGHLLPDAGYLSTAAVNSRLPCIPSFPRFSPSGMIVVIDYTPSEGEANIPITVNLELRTGPQVPHYALGHDLSSTSEHPEMKLRLVLGRTAVKTTVKRLVMPPRLDSEAPDACHTVRLRLHAFAPPHSEVRLPEQLCVPMTIQAMDSTTNEIEAFTFGTFTYWEPMTIRPKTFDNYMLRDVSEAPSSQLKRKHEEYDSQEYLHPALLAPSYSLPGLNQSLAVKAPGERRMSLVRTSAAPIEARDGNADVHEAELEWVATDHLPHPSVLDKKWTRIEIENGRRLVRFQRQQTGNKLRVSCEIIPQDAYNEEDIVISCIYRAETRNCWFTSVDVIYLLERLVGNPFSVEEKNRIRRNLEGLKPTTVSKHKPGFETFFQRIMDFPAPKPRNIEKDVKVFPWSVLLTALDKIIQKYSVVPSALTDSSPESPKSSLSPPNSAQEVDFLEATRSYSSSSHSQPRSSASQSSLHQAYCPSQPVHMKDSSYQVDSIPVIPKPDIDASRLRPEQLCTFPDQTSEDWRPRVSYASTQVDAVGGYIHTDAYSVHDANGIRMQAFTNPFAGNVTISGLSHAGPGAFETSGPYGHVIQGDSMSVQTATSDFFLTDLVNDAHILSRKSSGSISDLMYPGSDSQYSTGLGAESFSSEVHNELLQPHQLLSTE